MGTSTGSCQPFVKDTFTGTGMLQNQPEVAASQVPGNKWLLVQSAVIGESSQGIVLENVARNQAVNDHAFYLNTVPGPEPKHSVSVTVTFAVPSAANFVEVYTREDPTGRGYGARFAGDGSLAITRRNGPSDVVTLASTKVTMGLFPLVDGAIRLTPSAEGSTRKAAIDGSTKLTISDTTFLNTNLTGLSMQSVAPNSITVDDFIACPL